ncbi:Protein SWT21 [Nakaseomyces bracarensis]|uniref:Protein SWT21 n=1 Tax=Nakaseomyces bracarensis TaxID=273131 RepID=A0ABR4NUS7_9SACH
MLEKYPTIICSTLNTFDCHSPFRIWQTEIDQVVSLRKQLNYDLPNLQQSRYQEDLKEAEKLTICQDIYWSHDSTSFVTVHSDYGIRQYLRPDDSNSIGQLTPYSRIFAASSIISCSVHQNYSMYESNPDPTSHCILIGSRTVPIKLVDLESHDQLKTLVSYNITNEENEKFEVPFSLQFLEGPQFLAGSTRNKVSLYDMSRRDPIIKYSYNRKGKCGSTSYKSIISCFDKGSKVIICGSYKNQLFRVDTRSKSMEMVYRSGRNGNGNGYYQLINTNNDNYLYSFKRNSNKVDIIDLRKPTALLNQFTLPYTSDKRLKATYNGSELAIGTPNGTIISWETSTVESGGITRENKTEQCTPDTTYTSIPSTVINVVSSSPDKEVYTISYSPSTESNYKSGLALLEV